MPRSLTPWVLAFALAACRAPNAKLDVAPADGGTEPAREDLSPPQPGDLAAVPGADLATSAQAADLSTPIALDLALDLALAVPDLATAPPPPSGWRSDRSWTRTIAWGVTCPPRGKRSSRPRQAWRPSS